MHKLLLAVAFALLSATPPVIANMAEEFKSTEIEKNNALEQCLTLFNNSQFQGAQYKGNIQRYYVSTQHDVFELIYPNDANECVRIYRGQLGTIQNSRFGLAYKYQYELEKSRGALILVKYSRNLDSLPIKAEEKNEILNSNLNSRSMKLLLNTKLVKDLLTY